MTNTENVATYLTKITQVRDELGVGGSIKSSMLLMAT